MLIYFLIAVILLITSLSLFIILLKNKIDLLENHIKKLFNIRINTLPSIFEVTKNILIKHDEIFKDIIKLRKKSFSEKSLQKELIEIINTQQLIHNELNFIFKVSNRHHSLIKNGEFIYLRELIIENSEEIGKYLEIYKNIIYKFNLLIRIKNYSIIGLLFPINTKHSICS